MSSVSDCDATVKKLLTLRNEYLAHRGSRHVARGTFASLPVLERDEIATTPEPGVGHSSKVQRAPGIPADTLGSYKVQDFERLLPPLKRPGTCASKPHASWALRIFRSSCATSGRQRR